MTRRQLRRTPRRDRIRPTCTDETSFQVIKTCPASSSSDLDALGRVVGDEALDILRLRQRRRIVPSSVSNDLAVGEVDIVVGSISL